MMKLMTGLVLLLMVLLITGCLYFAFESRKEQEEKAVRSGLTMALVFLVLGIGLFVPVVRTGALCVSGLGVVFGLGLLIPATPNKKALAGARGYLAGEPVRFDERDTVFARYRSLTPGSERYRIYYSVLHPEKETLDAKRREKGFIGVPGSIDHEYQPNVAMMQAAFSIPPDLGIHAVSSPAPGVPKAELSPERAAFIVKQFARHIGADSVGICKIDPNLIYSHQGEIHYDKPEKWGEKIKDLPPYALVFLTEMNHGHVISAPHTPAVAESAHLYARGAYISTLLARWFAHMGYTGVAEHTRNYSLPLPPLAVDAGLGEIGRLGYLIAPDMGARCRIFAVLTDMPLAVDRPISLGVEEFCRVCQKCAHSCPSKSIPSENKQVYNGYVKWKLNEDTCYEYWSRVGTDCCVCMAICPFSRPSTLLHKLIRKCVAKSKIAQLTFPHVDNFLYGKLWKPKAVASWLDFRNKQTG